MSASTALLFQPLRVGLSNLKHRVVMAPLTRYRANTDHEHGDLGVEYYTQRASVPGTLLVTEATFIAARAGGYPTAPGIWTEKQIAAWKKITDAVHAKGSFIYLQLWALGRAAKPSVLKQEGLDFVSAGNIPTDPAGEAPRPLTIPEIKEYVQLYGTAASNAVHKAGFDGVEIHGANGYLVDQFLQTNSNNRTDEYGGSIENRTRFALEVIDSVVASVGVERTGIRLSPWSTYLSMHMPDPIPTFSALVTKIVEKHPELAYIHVVEPEGEQQGIPTTESNKFLRDIWGPRPFIAAAGFDREKAIKTVEEQGGLVAFGKLFIANPDLPLRLREGLELNDPNPNTFYTPAREFGFQKGEMETQSKRQR
ncbi:NADH:flavin oxidoreductase/NADH oxidase [Artomyces pyxidatus]|uniref:NADH:flavin oxidoreductase/NADH oxidase n=1 Tax=Artomyces pyxidatus TaxID=48021 RepID=A0ACB8T4Y1_9AGAM|nr:NADH:flavin oxidoreductase/NADH oxidase [Artomyces pyxidatus]